jgi:hypothetical protein
MKTTLMPALLVLSIALPLFPEDALPERDGLSINGFLQGAYQGYYVSPSTPQYLLDLYQYAPSHYANALEFLLAADAEYSNPYLAFSLKSTVDTAGDSVSLTIDELRGTVNVSNNISLGVGRIIYGWGKGYAFSAVGFVNPEKDPRTPEKRAQGIVSLDAEFLVSLPSDFFQTASASLLVIPGPIAGDNSFDIEDTDMALKLTFLIGGVDADVMGLYSSAGQHKVGADVSFNLLENLEFHGEAAYCLQTPKTAFDGPLPATLQEDSERALVGMRFLSPWNTTAVVEYFYNGAGYSTSEYGAFLAYNENILRSGNQQLIGTARRQSMPLLEKPAVMRDYINVKITQPEPFDLLYFTPSLSVLWNLDDLSLSCSASFSYAPFDNFEAVLTSRIQYGAAGSEMGSKPNPFQAELDLYFHY